MVPARLGFVTCWQKVKYMIKKYSATHELPTRTPTPTPRYGCHLAGETPILLTAYLGCVFNGQMTSAVCWQATISPHTHLHPTHARTHVTLVLGFPRLGRRRCPRRGLSWSLSRTRPLAPKGSWRRLSLSSSAWRYNMMCVGCTRNCRFCAICRRKASVQAHGGIVLSVQEITSLCIEESQLKRRRLRVFVYHIHICPCIYIYKNTAVVERASSTEGYHVWDISIFVETGRNACVEKWWVLSYCQQPQRST